MCFILTPPLRVKTGTAFSAIRLGEMELAESLVITMAGWSALQLLVHWRSEVGMLLGRSRDRGCIVTGLAIIERVTLPSEWWKMYLFGEEVVFQYQVLRVNASNNWLNPADWWKNIPVHTTTSSVQDNPISEWRVLCSELAEWCQQCDVLLNAIEAVEQD